MRGLGGGAIKTIIVMVVLLTILIGVVYGLMNREEANNQIVRQETRQTEITEDFIYRVLQNDNGTIATYIQNNDDLDEDLVKGREALAETLGLFMYYALAQNDQSLFNEVYKQLTESFLEDDGFINWKLNEDGTSEVKANALIDDIRILDALVIAGERWYKSHYMTTAVLISDYLNEHNVTNGVYTNFYDKEFDYASDDISLSYIDIRGMKNLVSRGLLDKEIVEKTAQVLKEAPLENGFYPVSYNVKENEYTYSDNINLVDQAILAYHYAQVGERSEELLEFVKDEIENRGLIHGMYELETKEPTVEYESPAIYGFLILYALEINENEVAQSIYERLKEFQVTDQQSEYYGGYSITDGDTHIFDNLIPLLAEQAIKNQ